MLIDYDKVKVYQQDTLILDDVSFHADEGEFIYLIGKVGSGKSSLLKTFYCELDLPQKETIPRTINRICEKSLMYAFQQQKRLIDDHMVLYVVEDEMLKERSPK